MSSLAGLDILLTDVITTQDRVAFLSSLNEASTALFTQDSTASLPENLVSFLKANQVDLTDPELIKDFLAIVKDQVQDLPQVGLTTAINWPESSRQKLSEWFTRHLGQPVILDLKVDKSLVAGAVVEFNGARKDYSVASRLSSRLSLSSVIPGPDPGSRNAHSVRYQFPRRKL